MAGMRASETIQPGPVRRLMQCVRRTFCRVGPPCSSLRLGLKGPKDSKGRKGEGENERRDGTLCCFLGPGPGPSTLGPGRLGCSGLY